MLWCSTTVALLPRIWPPPSPPPRPPPAARRAARGAGVGDGDFGLDVFREGVDVFDEGAGGVHAGGAEALARAEFLAGRR